MAGHANLLIIGVDPATAKGKLMAMALVHFYSSDDRVVYAYTHERITESATLDRITAWQRALLRLMDVATIEMRRPLDMVAIEDARPRGRGGAHMQTLVTTLKETARRQGVRVELIPPGTVKKHATGRGNAEAAEVAMIVRAEYKGAESIPVVVGEYDVEAAVAIAGAGYAMLQEEWLKEARDAQ